MSFECIMGLDIGTSGCKVLAIDESSRILGSVIKEYPLYTPKPGWSEQNPEDWWKAAVSGIGELIGRLNGWKIRAVGLTGQMHGMVPLDADRRVVRNAILWNDQRTAKQCGEITELAGGLGALLGYTNNRMLTGFTGGKILWMKENEPENYSRTQIILNPKDFIRFKLSGEYLTEVSDASGTGLFNVKERRWATGLIEKIGLKADLFPPVVESTAPAGKVSLAAAELTGLPEGTVISGGGGDAVISTTGLGLIRPGRVGITLGTSGVVAMVLPSYMENPDGLLQVSCNNAPGTYHAMGVTLSAAGSYQWFRNALGDYEMEKAKAGRTNAFRLLDQEAEKTPAGACGLTFLPYLTGERAPLNDPDATGAFLGITAAHRKGHFARAVMEGVAYSLKQVYNLILSVNPEMRPDEIVLAGGGANSPVWRQIFADVFNLPVRTVFGSAEGGSFGAALVAGVTAGVWSNLADTVKLIRPESETLPIGENVSVYQGQYQKYIRYYDALKWSYK